MKPTFAVAGAGAVGGYFGAVLLRAGFSVSVLGRGENLRAIQDKGLRVTTPDGEFTVIPTVASGNAAQIGPVDAVIIGVKAGQVAGVVAGLFPLMRETTKILTLQNGIEAHEQVSRNLGIQHSLIGVCRISASLIGPGHIQHHGLTPYIAFGEADGSKLSPQSSAVVAAFQSAGVTVETPEDIRKALWEKLLFIATVGGLGAISKSTAAEFRSNPETRRILLKLLDEAVAVGRAAGVNIGKDAVPRVLAYIDGLGPDITTSMHRDIVAGRPSELDAIVGPIVRLAKKRNVEAPYTTFLHASLLLQEARARSSKSNK